MEKIIKAINKKIKDTSDVKTIKRDIRTLELVIEHYEKMVDSVNSTLEHYKSIYSQGNVYGYDIESDLDIIDIVEKAIINLTKRKKQLLNYIQVLSDTRQLALDKIGGKHE